MEREFTFTFTRHKGGTIEENTDSIKAVNLDEAVKWATGFCERHNCTMSRIIWFDEEAQIWRNSVIQMI